jgi:uncharacterized DUF497 family protein
LVKPVNSADRHALAHAKFADFLEIILYVSYLKQKASDLIENSLCNAHNNVYNYAMRFTWHEVKRKTNIKKHGIDFADAHKVFAGPTFTFEDNRFNYAEQRWITIGLCNLSVVVIVHNETEDEIHIISMRKAEKHEQEIFFENL